MSRERIVTLVITCDCCGAANHCKNMQVHNAVLHSNIYIMNLTANWTRAENKKLKVINDYKRKRL